MTAPSITAQRRAEEKEQRRQSILDAAAVVVARKGVDALTMVMADKRVTHTVWTETSLGRLSISIEGTEPLAIEQLEALAKCLRVALAGAN